MYDSILDENYEYELEDKSENDELFEDDCNERARDMQDYL